MSLDGSSSLLTHRAQDFGLIVLSLLFLPFNTCWLGASLLLDWVRWLLPFSPRGIHKSRAMNRRRDRRFRPRKVLVTGVGMTKGLVIARAFYQTGHTVIGADFESDVGLVVARWFGFGATCGSVSRGLQAFYPLAKPDVRLGGSAPYIQSLLEIIVRERIDLWVSCSGVASAVEDGEAREIIEKRTRCRALQFTVDDTQVLHRKSTFIARAAELGLSVPETHPVTSEDSVFNILGTAPTSRRKYIMKPIGMVDDQRGNMTLLPLKTTEATKAHLQQLQVSGEVPWILQQFIKGTEFCTHSIVIRGEVKAFVACPSAELLMHYEALPNDSPLTRAMLSFTKTVAHNSGPNFTGHLSFDFIVETQQLENHDPDQIVLYPIECNPRAHTAVVLFNGTSEMIDAYLTLLTSTEDSNEEPWQAAIATPQSNDRYYWIGHDLVKLVILPLWAFLTMRLGVFELLKNLRKFLGHIAFWKDGTYEIWDPLPFWWLYHVQIPYKLLYMLCQGEKWSRINVSTMKMFTC